mgnify:CR=1 FL=1
MPKMRTRRGAAKRFTITSSGRIKCRKSNRRHLLVHKTTKRKRQLRGSFTINPTVAPAVRAMLPYG